ncbi:unnamed protein product [Notodromas monacha]|uniref:SSD domain-containing protein n=1 Tax=Notodromas monacha TaxID=399045 RepID=A0A7R9G7S6_9CRUS|nr:unnamed protein product [Notodromas monacha]CAG0912381.1 unnamed protein product [Notodromas monacha]
MAFTDKRAVVDDAEAGPSKSRKGCMASVEEALDYISIVIQDSMESCFYRLGVFMGTYPLRTIGFALFACAVLGGGMFFFQIRDDQDVWLPYNSELRQKKQWLEANFPPKLYFETALIVGDNVLTPDVLQFMSDLDAMVSVLETDEASWESLCARPGQLVPLMGADVKLELRRKRAISGGKSDVNAIHGSNVQETQSLKPSEGDTDDAFEMMKSTGAPATELKPFLVSGPDLTKEATPTIESISSITPVAEVQDDGFFQSIFGFEVDEDVQKLFRKYMKHMDKGGQCMKSNVLSLFEESFDKPSDDIDYANLSQSFITGEFTKVLHQKSLLSDAQNLSLTLSGIFLDANGSVAGAKGAIMTWLVESPLGPEMSPENIIINVWERKFIKSVLEFSVNNSLPGVKVYAFGHFSFKDAMASMQDQNMAILFGGFALILIYVTITLGKFNCLEQRILISLVGVMNVALSILASYGLCSYAGLFFGPIHPILPFLLLGIGVDDMFVIVQALKTLSPTDKAIPVPQRIGYALKSAGVSITITSATDILAFGIGSTTVMPSLSSFCLFAAAGILCVFLLQLTVFVPCLALDEKRMDSRKNACCPCVPMAVGYEPNTFSQKSYLVLFFKRVFAPVILSTPVKILATLLCLGMVAVNFWGMMHMQHNFDPRKYITWGSYQDLYLKAMEQYFPHSGETGAFHIGQIDYWKETDALEELYSSVVAERSIRTETVDFWHHSFVQWIRKNNRTVEFDEEIDFVEALREFLLGTRDGHHYLQDITFNGTLLGEFQILTSLLKYKHVPLTLSYDREEAMNAISNIERSITFMSAPPGQRHLGAYTVMYITWQANKIISGELVRNLGLTMSAVFAVTLVLIGDVRVSLWVFACVAFTLVDIAGSMHFWGLNIEIVTSICLILAVGLAVDYAAHIGHMFVALKGTKQERAEATLVRIGPAVFNGAFSTFLALVMLGYTDDYAFSAFFKVFFCVVFYGSFHGLIFLPVILSLVGPSTTYRPAPLNNKDDTGRRNSQELMENGNGCAGLRPCETANDVLSDDDDEDLEDLSVHPKSPNGVKYHEADSVDDSAVHLQLTGVAYKNHDYP